MLDSESFNYTLVSGEGDDDNGKFTIINSFLMSSAVFDYETQSSFSIRISSTDDTFESFEKEFEILVTSTVSAESKMTDASSFVLYPNPSADHFQLASTALGNHSLKVQLIDMSGKVLSSYEGQLQEINAALSESSGTLAKGVYFVRIDVNGQSITKKFVKL